MNIQVQPTPNPNALKFILDTTIKTEGKTSFKNPNQAKEVNLAARLESLAEPGEILISYETFSQVKDKGMCRDKGEITVKGFNRPVPMYQIVDFRRDIGAGQSFIEHETGGFALYLDTDKVDQEERTRIVKALENAAEKLRDQG